MTKLAKEIDLLEKKIKLIKNNYQIFSYILIDIASINNETILSIVILLEKLETELRIKNFQRSKETRQLDLENLINEIKENSIDSLDHSTFPLLP